MSTTNVDPAALRAAAGQSEEMQAGVGTALGGLSAHHQAIPGQTEGLDMVRELLKTHQSWHDRLEDVKKECAEVARSLRATAGNYEHNDEQTAKSFTRPATQSTARHATPFG
ncbi:type VII secretion target [Streptomyces noursei]|uniref:type VII secretion target n=1 Tax=Streptomyces noursei TaxID=1971 RepID=UPI0035D5525E